MAVGVHLARRAVKVEVEPDLVVVGQVQVAPAAVGQVLVGLRAVVVLAAVVLQAAVVLAVLPAVEDEEVVVVAVVVVVASAESIMVRL